MTVKLNQPPAGLAETLARARLLKPRLEDATDEMNRSIQEVEAELVALQLGVRASVNLESETDPEFGSTWYRSLIFGKDAKVWRLLIAEGRNDDPGGDVYTPLVNASREVRLRATEHLPLLVQELVTTAEAEIARVEAATKAAKAVASAIKVGGAK
ncbi:hypothetical protein FJV41_44555 [Myxococcus llanfairpwllgwyngyllgogerychwyrndrobwllllantysiliogogogochensis]|uniref:Uncharacterized protein n=1 Tax=Myxococcus llanfairpwllgwyngyllgogerychwyrndrobwllllantysiliogogogochensis TaxID=2590453 RepID=A0A540WKA8_9BACT|nr:hypothetical protein [Myxococcus llanfairpwllgwyngyllgogerychwyrndrobwllllantysiliogogogochensis]TQF09456.1 hypothetical protein FJV41_44555 [Myxococcus llanfairpwllgwyngyllgogerychwyrndrobwllllantysiliogogogochensis]